MDGLGELMIDSLKDKTICQSAIMLAEDSLDDCWDKIIPISSQILSLLEKQYGIFNYYNDDLPNLQMIVKRDNGEIVHMIKDYHRKDLRNFLRARAIGFIVERKMIAEQLTPYSFQYFVPNNYAQIKNPTDVHECFANIFALELLAPHKIVLDEVFDRSKYNTFIEQLSKKFTVPAFAMRYWHENIIPKLDT